MRILGFIALAMTLAMPLSGCISGTNVAVVNPNRLFQESISGKAGMSYLKNIETTMQEQLQAAQKIIEQKPGDENLRVRIQQEFAGYQQLMSNEQQKTVEGINQQILTSIESVRQTKKIDAIFYSENVPSFDGKLDVTSDVLAEMNRTPLEFVPAPITPIENVLKDVKKDNAESKTAKSSKK